jgi:hypothetical protein
MKYLWPYDLPSGTTNNDASLPEASSFFEPAFSSILGQLRASPVLESCAGTMTVPSQMKFVPSDLFADQQSIPFVSTPRTAGRYLSWNYPTWTIPGVSSLGVEELTSTEFLRDLDKTISQDPDIFRARSNAWHSQLADTLIKLATDEELMSILQGMCIIPLQNGTWASARGNSLFLSKNETSMEIPIGIEILVVDPIAEADPIRRKLFKTLGVKAWEAPEICRLVMALHGASDFIPESLTREQLVSQASFVYRSSWQPPKATDLWFATIQDERCRGRKLYIPGGTEANSPAARIFAQLQGKFAVIHNDYLEAFPDDVDWRSWLVKNLGLSMVPRLINPIVDPELQPVGTFEVPKIIGFEKSTVQKAQNEPEIVPINNPGSSSIEQPPILTDALSYLDRLKICFSNEPEVYNSFLDIMRGFKSEA